MEGLISFSKEELPWNCVPIDISKAEGHRLETESLTALDLFGQFGILGPDELPCLSMRYHLAHKFHGATAGPVEGHPNERAHDAIDLLLFRALVTDLSALRAACVDVFESRGRQTWPPHSDPPDDWGATFERMASEVGLEIKSLPEAVLAIRGFIDEIEKAHPSSANEEPKKGPPISRGMFF
jgi:hypothetical protein